MVDIGAEIETVLGILDGDTLDRALRRLLIFCDSDETTTVMQAWGQIDRAQEMIRELRGE